MTERIAVYPGSFDPITMGHENIARRALSVADRVVVAVGNSPSYAKSVMFTVGERVSLIEEVFVDEPRISAVGFSGLLVDFARSVRASMVVRGVRSVTDFEYEVQMAVINRRMCETLETIFLTADPTHASVSSALVRQIAVLGGEVSQFVPASIVNRIREKAGAGSGG